MGFETLYVAAVSLGAGLLGGPDPIFLCRPPAGIHIAFAFPIITKLLAILNLTNVGLFAWCTAGTILVFALFYALVYGLTAKVYYRIVSWGMSA